MALVSNLYHVGRSLAKVLHTELNAIVAIPESSIQVGPPVDDPTGTADQVRVSLMWVTEQPAHKNDLPHRRTDGTEERPPITVSAFFMISTYGATAAGDASRAHELLGNVLQTFHVRQNLRLPVAGLTFGEGPLNVTLVPTTPEVMEKLFSPLQTRHRPFALYEVSPVQLVNLRGPRPGAGLVAPGGLELTGPLPITRPGLARIIPAVQGRGGRIRIDGVWPSARPDRIVISGIEFAGAALTVLDPGRTVTLDLPLAGANAVPAGTHRVSAWVGQFASEPMPFAVMADTEPTIDSPTTLVHSQAAPLVLTGRALDTVTDVFAWPDAGIRAPSDVVSMTPAAVATTQINVPSGQLGALQHASYRMAGRLAGGGFTPFVVVEIIP